MKKLLNFSFIIALLGVVGILLFLCPSVKIANQFEGEIQINLFQATFGGAFLISSSKIDSMINLNTCPGLIVALIFAIVGVCLSLAKFKCKWVNLLSFPFYLTAGILAAFAAPMVEKASKMRSVGTLVKTYENLGGAIAVSVIFCVLAAFALLDFLFSVAKPKPKQQETY